MTSGSLKDYLRLCRLPAVFTALADICAGYLLTHESLGDRKTFFLLCGSSAGLYLSGMVWNDIFDIRQDRIERPRRPIPSGAVSPRNAVRFAVGLMITGIVLAGLASLFSLVVALLLAGAILLYDGLLKRTPAAFPAMGLCRFLNLLLGASAAAETFPQVWGQPQLWIACAMGVYITGVTLFARREASTGARPWLVGGLFVLDIGLAMLALWITGQLERWGWQLPEAGASSSEAILLFLGIVALTLNRRAILAIQEPVPRNIQSAVGSMLLSVITLDAMVIYYQLGEDGMGYTLGTLALMIPAIFLRRVISIT